jgi:Glycosyl transferase family 2
MILTVVIPTFNRGHRLGVAIDHLLQCDTEGLQEIEVIVVDDGSPMPATPVVSSRQPRPPFTLRCVRQNNGGPQRRGTLGFGIRGERSFYSWMTTSSRRRNCYDNTLRRTAHDQGA